MKKSYRNFLVISIFMISLVAGFGGISSKALAYPPCNDPEGPICFGICKSDGCNPWPPPPEKLPDPFRLMAPAPLEFHEHIINFYDNNLNIGHPWSMVGEMTTGASGVAFNSLVLRLIDYGFYSDSTGAALATSYNSKIASAVADLQKALNIKTTTATSGVFTVATRDSFKAFILDLLAAAFNAGEKIVNLDIIWADGRVSLFNVGQRFSAPSTSFINIPARSTIPTFIRKDNDGKVYKWDRATKKWNLSTAAFPSPISTPTSTGTSIKGSLTTFASSMSTIGAQINSNFSTSRTVSPGFNSATVVPSILNFLYRTGFSAYNPLSTATIFGPTSTDATVRFQSAVGINPTGSFDNNTATASKTISDQIVAAINAPSLPANISGFLMEFPADKSMSVFSSIDGKFIRSVPPPACGGIKQPPCAGILTFKCCTADGEWCTTASAGGTCSGTGNSFCGSEGFKCRDQF